MKNTDKPCLTYLVGLPASGKSTWAETHKDKLNAIIHSSDSIRAELGNINDQSKNTEVFEILHKRIKDDLRAGKNVIYDATSLSRKRRIAFLNELKNIPCEKVCVLFATPYEMCIARNFARERQVPEDVLVRMYKNFETPTIYEGFDDVQIVWSDYKGLPGFEFDLKTDMLKWCDISHNNKHHTLTIGDHMRESFNHLCKKDTIYKPELYAATYLHDCGKPFTKAFVNSSGEACEEAHFYNHQNVGAFLSLFYLREFYPDWLDEKILYTSLLINLHMNPFLSWDQSEKAKEKDIRLFGDEIINLVDILHECDLAAH